MGNRVLNTALLSLATASVLSTSAMAEVTVTSEDLLDTFTAKAGRLDVTKLSLAVNTVSKLNSIVVKVSDTNTSHFTGELNTNIITSLKLFQRGLDSTDVVGSVNVSDVNTSGKEFTITLSKDVFFKTLDDVNPNQFYVSAMYGDFPAKEVVPYDSKVNFKITQINVTEEYYSDVTTKTVNQSAFTHNVTSLPIDQNFTIDRAEPILKNMTDLNDSRKVYDNLFNTNYYYNNNTVILEFNEAMNTGLVSLNSANSSFKFKDSLDKQIPVTEATWLGNALTLKLNSFDLNSSSGGITMTYAGGIIQDKFGNELVVDNTNDGVDGNISSKVLVKDTDHPQLAKFVLDFDNKSKGTLTFSEVVSPKVWSAIEVKNALAEDNVSIVGSSIVATNKQDDANNSSLRTVISFDLNKIVSTPNLKVTYTQKADGNITDKAGNAISNNLSIDHNASLTGFDLVESGKWNLISLTNKTRTTSKHILKTGSVQVIWDYLGNNKWNAFPSELEAGKGYWIKSANVETADINFSQVEVGFDDTKTKNIDSTTFIKNADAKNKWALLGMVSDMKRSDMYSQVADGCYGVSIYDYNTIQNGWNMDQDIAKHQGIWVKQDCSLSE